QRWSFAGGKGSFIQRDPLEDAVECEATFRYEHAADGQLTINPTGKRSCLQVRVIEAFRFGGRYYFGGRYAGKAQAGGE
ncbi:MAG: hypothetical protein ACI9MR_005151, partial [Myxococcota bacterium]